MMTAIIDTLIVKKQNILIDIPWFRLKTALWNQPPRCLGCQSDLKERNLGNKNIKYTFIKTGLDKILQIDTNTKTNGIKITK